MQDTKISKFVAYIVLVIIAAIASISAIYIANKIQANQPSQAITPPVVTVPSSTVEIATSSASPTLMTVVLSSSTFIPPQNLLTNLNVYKSSSIRLVLNGKFVAAQISVSGTVTESGNHFIYFSYGTTGGDLNAARLSADSLDLDLTSNLGGVFTNQQPMNFVVNLLGSSTIAATNAQFLLNRQPTEVVNFWNSNLLPPTVNSFVIAPFNQSGVVGGATINEVDFQYACAASSSCVVNVCPLGTLATVCLKNDVGLWAAQDWCSRSNAAGCKNL